MVGHLSYLLLVVSMLMRSMTRLRILVILSALVAITYDGIWLKDPVGIFWETALLTVNVVQIALQRIGDRRARFSGEEAELVRTRLGSLSRSDARRVIDMGFWADGPEGTVLTSEGFQVANLVYLSAGRVDILCGNALVGACVAGNFVGEMSVLSGEPASATAIVAEPSRYWMIPATRLRSLHETHPGIARALELGIAHDLRSKIITANAARGQA